MLETESDGGDGTEEMVGRGGGVKRCCWEEEEEGEETSIPSRNRKSGKK